MRDVFVHGCGDYYAPVANAPPDMRSLVKEATGQGVRRVGRFIQLALIGAGRCIGAAKPAPDTAIYFSSGRGDLEVTIEVMEHLFRDGFAPKPLSFINTVSNAACFYIAKHFALHGRSCFLGNSFFSFEAALELALLDLRFGAVKSALVGAVDIVTAPLAVHRRRLRLGEDAPVGEGAHWLWLTTDPEGALGQIEAARCFGHREALYAWLATQELEGALFAAGQFLSPEDARAVSAEAGTRGDYDYRADRAYYDSQSGAAVSAFLAQRPAPRLLHINTNPDGQYAALLARA